MFVTLYAIENIVWYQNIENSKPRGYEKTKREIIEAVKLLKDFGYSTPKTSTLDFPDHQNDTILYLENLFEKAKRIQQGKKVIDKLKTYFEITKLTATNEKKAITYYKKTKRITEKLLEEDKSIMDKSSVLNYKAYAEYKLRKTRNPFSKFRTLCHSYKP